MPQAFVSRANQFLRARAAATEDFAVQSAPSFWLLAAGDPCPTNELPALQIEALSWSNALGQRE